MFTFVFISITVGRGSCKSRKSRNTWRNRQIWPWSTERNRAKAKEFCQENTLVIANTLFQQHKGRLYTWTLPDGQHQNQIDYIFYSPYDYTAEVRYRFKGLDLIDRVPDELWMEVHDTVQEAGIKTIPRKKKCKKAKWLSEEALQIAEKRRHKLQARRNRKIYPFEYRVSKYSKER